MNRNRDARVTSARTLEGGPNSRGYRLEPSHRNPTMETKSTLCRRSARAVSQCLAASIRDALLTGTTGLSSRPAASLPTASRNARLTHPARILRSTTSSLQSIRHTAHPITHATTTHRPRRARPIPTASLTHLMHQSSAVSHVLREARPDLAADLSGSMHRRHGRRACRACHGPVGEAEMPQDGDDQVFAQRSERLRGALRPRAVAVHLCGADGRGFGGRAGEPAVRAAQTSMKA